ncbi:protein serine/threonine phosphatase 2C [Punctularia strigosozonata HHB-11173 SS5]|uniref:protein serine/threonine phosphatase 2C n=1 Tax=Punctularia strigosozonata (strain HHB-11173) TaxID=741275 RepID=UPI00044169AF|nr:protein serine/threonine phosphatase 2C [Punctularia strigosozonata HHB-11173 SS5]EIN07379.1 protein serine/threonine phosphatase 2C [Punctularia strigosozonata HHB-11173 SS5]
MGLPRNALAKTSRRLHAQAVKNARTYTSDAPPPPPKSHPYTFHVGVGYAGKPPDRIKRRFAAFPSGHPIATWRDEMLALPWEKGYGPSNNARNRDAGEDFFYVQQMREQSGLSVGVADGVGGWVDSGVDPSLFSQALMFHSARYARSAWAGEPEIDPTTGYEDREEVEGWEMAPGECLSAAYGAVLRERAVLAGSSTACLLNFNASSGLLRSANLGDSGFLIIRSSAVFYKQQPQTHYFNCPKQLTKMPNNTNMSQAGNYIDQPEDAALFETKLRDGDLIIAYTDGLSDNVFPSEIAHICALVGKTSTSEAEHVQAVANRIVAYAQGCMVKQGRVSPFEQAAARNGKWFRGGKLDDITVIVTLVRETI